MRRGEPERFPGAQAQARAARTATASPGGSSATAASGWSAARPRACSAEWPRCPGRNGPTTPPRCDRRSARVPHVFTHFALDLHDRRARRAGRRRLVAAARRPRRGRPADPLPPRRRSGARIEERACRLSPSSPARDSTAPTSCAPIPSALPSWPRAATRAQLVWRDGLPALDERRPARLAAADRDPTLFLGLDGRRSRASRAIRAAARRCPRRISTTLGTLADGDAPLFAAALSLANWHSPPPLLRELRRIRPSSTAAAGRGAARLRAPSISRASTRW